MDLDEWELLPIDGFLDFGEDCEKKDLLGKRRAADSTTTLFDVDLDYFRCPSPRSKLSPQSQLVPVRIQLDPPLVENGPCEAREAGEKNRAASVEEGDAAPDQDAVSQVFFKKMKENEFVDMKILESPRSGSRPISPPIENFHFEDVPETLESSCSPRKVPEGNCDIDREVVGEEVSRGGLNIWKWSLTGIGALCSFGVAAATICTIIIIGSHQRNKQKIRFQIYTDDKRIKEVVRHATKLNEAISAAKGVPLTRANITLGGYYEGL
ncbi:uncharacterized protein LOC116205223 [Punica granatum]|uniref:DUF6821 domain-containing protein n=2 Tax=Punica granatum TaxID=22663 RepID=A0A218WLU5_PUNGR|nr:uncharacterized protein LOC116205223 [Punica granatum]OWM73221.1 hypothetical protein CDL15_Pgr001335 [Punica granatum]PKI77355.1 hypothetical protein CRG98_002300 [Punica granatum]